jgi:hypothetical protein
MEREECNQVDRFYRGKLDQRTDTHVNALKNNHKIIAFEYLVSVVGLCWTVGKTVSNLIQLFLNLFIKQASNKLH